MENQIKISNLKKTVYLRKFGLATCERMIKIQKKIVKSKNFTWLC